MLAGMRRWGAVLAAMLAVSGCIDPGAKSALRVANWGGASDGTEFARQTNALIREFEGGRPGREVRVEGIPDQYVSKMLLSHVAGAMSDVMVLDASSAAVFIDNGLLMDLTPLIERDPEFDLAVRWPNVVDIARRRDALYAIPNGFTPMVMFCNRALFERAGVELPTPPWNFETFRALARDLTRRRADGSVEQYGFSFANWAPGWIMWLWNNGGDVLSPDGERAAGTLDSERNAATLAFLRDLIQRDGSAPSLSQAAAMGVDLFAKGRAAMTVTGHWSLVPYSKSDDIRREDLIVVELPTNLARSQTVFYESGYAITAQVRHPGEAWEFIKHMTSFEARMRLTAAGIEVDGRRDVAEERAKDRLEAMFLPIVPQARPPWGSRVEGFEVVERAMQDAMDSVLNSNTPPIDALRRAARRVDREFAKRK